MDRNTGRKVAIKFLPRHIVSESEERKRFEIEAKATAALNHPNITTIHAIEKYEDEIFLVMEYIDGRELKEIIYDSGNELNEISNIESITEQIIVGLKSAHDKDIIHRDIKSSNIMVTKDGIVKIMDFGLAKFRINSVSVT